MAKLPTIVRLSGALLRACVVFLEHSAFQGNNPTPTVAARACHELATAGPNRWVRHPPSGGEFVGHVSWPRPAANLFVGLFAVVTFLGRAEPSLMWEAALSQRDGNPYASHAAVAAAS
jgi:protein-S-isoprenylcysteine O-methyltransferase Ste14